MRTPRTIALAVLVSAAPFLLLVDGHAEEICQGFGPQTPRDISSTTGSNPRVFATAPDSDELNLCNIHTHTNAEHKGPGFSVFVNESEHGGYRCNDADTLSDSERSDLEGGDGAYEGVQPGDTIEVHWVHTSCAVEPIEFAGSTNGPSYTQSTCSPLQVTWSVRPQCAKLDIGSLHRWAEEGNVFGEVRSHGVRQLVTDERLLSEIE